MGWQAALEDHYPDLARALERIEAQVGNRPVAVSEVVARADSEVARIEAVLHALGQDLGGVVSDAVDEAAAGADRIGIMIGTRLSGCLYLAFELGLWLGEGHLASIDPNHVERRMAVIDRTRAAGGVNDG